jgi:hypothetical protein
VLVAKDCDTSSLVLPCCVEFTLSICLSVCLSVCSITYINPLFFSYSTNFQCDVRLDLCMTGERSCWSFLVKELKRGDSLVRINGVFKRFMFGRRSLLLMFLNDAEMHRHLVLTYPDTSTLCLVAPFAII